MPKPKPPSPAELARQAAEKELPGLRKALEDMLDQPIPVDEIIQPEHDTASGDAKLDDGEEDKDSENNEVVDPDNEDADSEDEEWGEVDEEEYEEGYEEGLEEDVDTSFQKVEVLGVCVVTEALIKETLGIYNKDAIRWIEKNDVLITEQGQRAANLAYPWVLRVLGSHREFSLNGKHRVIKCLVNTRTRLAVLLILSYIVSLILDNCFCRKSSFYRTSYQLPQVVAARSVADARRSLQGAACHRLLCESGPGSVLRHRCLSGFLCYIGQSE